MTPPSTIHADSGYNLTEIAVRAGIDRAYLSRVLHHRQVPSVTIAQRIASAMALSLDEFYHRLYDPTQP
jgi:transcriptional regulator with XRE-family HTH domain